MSTDEGQAQLETAIAEAELTDAEADQVRELVAGGGFVGAAVEHVLAERDTEPAASDEPPPPAEGEEPTQAQLNKLTRQIDTHHSKVRTIMGGFVSGFEPCSECGGVGLTAPGPRPQTNPLFEPCSTCRGFGDVLTGSLKEGHQSRPCPSCLGRGYLEEVNANGVPVAPDARQQGGPVVPPIETLVQQNGGEATQTEQGGTRMGTPSWMGDTTLGG